MSAEAVEKIICAICDKPIERRRELVVRRLKPFHWEAVHFRCRTEEISMLEQHWSEIETMAVNTTSMKIVGPFGTIFCILYISFILWLGDIDLIRSAQFAGGLLGISIVILSQVTIAYFKYERKVPK